MSALARPAVEGTMTRPNDDRTRRRPAGLPPDARMPDHLLFDVVTSTLILSCTSTTGTMGGGLYIRSASARRYTSVTDLFLREHTQYKGRTLLVTSWILGHRSHLFATLAELRGPEMRATGQGRAMVAIGLGPPTLMSLDLRNRSSHEWQPAAVAARRGIIARLVGSDEGDEHVYAVVGFPGARRGLRTTIGYYLTSISWDGRPLRRLRSMPDVWF